MSDKLVVVGGIKLSRLSMSYQAHIAATSCLLESFSFSGNQLSSSKVLPQILDQTVCFITQLVMPQKTKNVEEEGFLVSWGQRQSFLCTIICLVAVFYFLQKGINLKWRVLNNIFDWFYPMKEGYGQAAKGELVSDWVCLNCSNLNYSFRKICNRCKSISREENQHNIIQMQYMQAYYQPFPALNDNRIHEVCNKISTPLLDRSKSDDGRCSFRKESTGVESCEGDSKHQEGMSTQSESRFLFLLDNAWEVLYNTPEVSQFKTCEEVEKTREEEEPEYEQEDILTNFDFSFI